MDGPEGVAGDGGLTGYLHPGYAGSLSHLGEPRSLPECGGWILERQIPESPHRDAVGCYPVFTCVDWSRLRGDLDRLGDELVSIVVVSDPFGDYDLRLIRSCFPDIVQPYKNHFVVDLEQPVSESVSRHHRYYARRALKTLGVERCPASGAFLDEWVALYENLIRRHHITEFAAFSRENFEKQFAVPGLEILRVVDKGLTLGAQLWYVQGDLAYSHLTAFSNLGYRMRAAYALYWQAIEHFRGRLRWLDLGGGAGRSASGKDGLSEFKRGWATGTRNTYLCGRILNHRSYNEVASHANRQVTDFFPTYRGHTAPERPCAVSPASDTV